MLGSPENIGQTLKAVTLKIFSDTAELPQQNDPCNFQRVEEEKATLAETATVLSQGWPYPGSTSIPYVCISFASGHSAEGNVSGAQIQVCSILQAAHSGVDFICLAAKAPSFLSKGTANKPDVFSKEMLFSNFHERVPSKTCSENPPVTKW